MHYLIQQQYTKEGQAEEGHARVESRKENCLTPNILWETHILGQGKRIDGGIPLLIKESEGNSNPVNDSN